MTTVSVGSVKGAPGVTTLACLVAAAWPEGRRVLVVEGDPAGGDLAARFQLSAQRGWPSFVPASRRLDGMTAIAEHAQRLPGGLDVMVGTGCTARSGDQAAVAALMRSAGSDPEGPWDVIADIGRLLPEERGAEPWLEHSTAVAIVIRRDAASVLRVRERAAAFRRRCPGAIGLVVVGPGPFGGKEIERFTELPVLAEVPDDPDAARIAGGTPGRVRRLPRSSLLRSARRLASRLSTDQSCWPHPSSSSSPAAPSPRPVEAADSRVDPPVVPAPGRNVPAVRGGDGPDAGARASRRQAGAGSEKALR